MAGGRVRSVPRGLAGATSVAVAAAALIMLTGCTGSDEQPTPTTSPTSSQTTSSAVPTAAPTLAPKGSAQENKAFFDYVNQRTINTAKNPTAEQFVAGLAAAGFDKADMQMTADRTTVNLTPGSVQFSVLINHGCLIGQFGQDIGGYHSMVASVLSTGKCLIGDTVPVH
ncbi:DUF6993 domain-containing protein [Humibacter ginsenosidimutans]|uniref:DUF6993 domain-containing protein n=1 Tax=Humibacter ginsenosidimutans TaxID=2599293 RepID=A0A5B8LZU4_9MICO|nr:hypothetical protein [Humibacter ginsenosidimutans]QDZ14038.1 hypothetical protein FPZ11_03910 [Humibacter ginsenosidimutans]